MTPEELESLEELALVYYGKDKPETIMDKLWMAQSNLKVAEEKGLDQALIDSFLEQINLLTIAWDKKSTKV